MEQQVRAESFDGNTGRSLGEVRKRTRFVRPNHIRIDQVGLGSAYVLYTVNAGLTPADLAAKPPDFKPVLSSR
jgi:hypothetical protein